MSSPRITSMLFKQENDSQSLVEWNEKFAKAGCNKNLIHYVVRQKVIKDYENLFNTFNKLPPDLKIKMNEPWQLYCLSGEKDAFNEVIKLNNEHIKNVENKIEKCKEDIRLIQEALKTEPERRRKQRTEKLKSLEEDIKAYSSLKFLRDQSGANPLHYAALSSNPEQIQRALNISIPFQSKDNYRFTVAYYAALSGNVSQLSEIKALEKEHGLLSRNPAKRGRNVLQLAALHGNEEVILLAANFMQDLKATDQHGFNALDFAHANNNTQAAEALIKLGLTSANNLNDFYFAGMEVKREFAKLRVA